MELILGQIQARDLIIVVVFGYVFVVCVHPLSAEATLDDAIGAALLESAAEAAEAAEAAAVVEAAQAAAMARTEAIAAVSSQQSAGSS